MKKTLRLCVLVACVLIAHFLPAQTPEEPGTKPLPKTWVVDGTVNTFVRSGDTAYLGGAFKYIGPFTGGGAMLDLADGNLTNNNALRIKGRVMTAAPDGKGGWFIGGDFTEIQGIPRMGIAHVNADNSLDDNWNVDVTYASYPRMYPYITYLTVANNTLYFLGDFVRVNGQDRYKAAAVDASTGRVMGWHPELGGSVHTLTARNNLIYAGGLFSTPEGQTYLAALDAVTGKATPWRLELDGAVYSIAFSGNTMFLAGDFEKVAGAARRRLVAVNLSTSEVTPWNPYMGGYAKALLTRGDTVFVGGWFSEIAGAMRDNLAALDAVSGEVLDWNARDVPLLEQNNLALANNTIYVSGGTRAGSIISYLGAYDAATGQRTAWTPGALGPVHCIAASGKTAFAGGNFNSAGGKLRNHAAAIHLGAGTITAWNPDLDGQVNRLLRANGLVYAGGSFTKAGGVDRSGLAALDPATGKPAAWHPNVRMIYDNGLDVNGYVHDMVAENGLLYAGGYFSQVGGQSRKHAAAVDMTTGKAAPWNPGSNYTVNSIAVFGHLVYLAGEFTTMGDKTRQGLASVYKSTGQVTGWRQDLET
ncbi:MAG TPA: hypothetical protein VF646_10010, partial [Cytophagales bacterium]